MTTGEGLLAVAQALLDVTPSTEFHLRRSISTAYYAAMHAVLDFAVGELDGEQLLPGIVKYQLQRSVEHAHPESLGNQLNNNQDLYAQFQNQFAIRALGRAMAELYKWRIEADYDLSKPVELTTAETMLARGIGVLHLLTQVAEHPADARLLAVKVLLPVRNKR